MSDQLPPGRELDALVTEKVMGGKVEHDWDDFDGGDISRCRGCGYFDQDDSKPEFCTPNYSTNMSAAWTIVEKLQGELYLEWGMITCGKKPCASHKEGHIKYEVCFKDAQAFAPTAEHAICLAALDAVEAISKK